MPLARPGWGEHSLALAQHSVSFWEGGRAKMTDPQDARAGKNLGVCLVQLPITSWTISMVAEKREMEAICLSRLYDVSERVWT